MRPFNIAIAGCGPAGLGAALLLGRDGHQVTLFERFDAPQPIGSGLMIQPTGLAILKVLGLQEKILSLGARIERLFGQTGNEGHVVLDVSYAALGRRAGFGVGIHRASLFAVLHDAVVAEKIPIETSRTIRGSSVENNGGRYLQFESGNHEGPFDLVVDALGTRSPLAPPTGRALDYGALWASLDWPDEGFDGSALEQRYRRASVMAGVLPIGTPPHQSKAKAAFFWSLRQDGLDDWLRYGLDSWKSDVVALWPATQPLLDQIHHPDQLTFARYAHRTLPAPAQPGLIHIGDAWHSASPQLGQGANMALLDAYALRQSLRMQPDISSAIHNTIRLRNRHVQLYQLMSRLFTPVYQSDSVVLPFVRDRLVGPLSKLWPATWIQAAMVSGLIGNPLKRLGLN